MSPGARDHFGHTRVAEANRARKVLALAATAARLGVMPFELTLVGGTTADRDRRDRVRRECGLDKAPSVETWTAALVELERRVWALPGVSPCLGCGWPVRSLVSVSGHRLLVDPLPREDGTVAVTPAPRGLPVGWIIAGHETPPEDEPLYRQHARSCPTSAAHHRAQAPRCLACNEPLDGVLAARDPSYTTHPGCYAPGEVKPDG